MTRKEQLQRHYEDGEITKGELNRLIKELDTFQRLLRIRKGFSKTERRVHHSGAIDHAKYKPKNEKCAQRIKAEVAAFKVKLSEV